MAWLPDGKRIASGGEDKTVQVWDAADGGHAFTYHGHPDWMPKIAWSPDGTRIALAGDDNTVQVWQVEQPMLPGARVASPPSQSPASALPPSEYA